MRIAVSRNGQRIEGNVLVRNFEITKDQGGRITQCSFLILGAPEEGSPVEPMDEIIVRGRAVTFIPSGEEALFGEEMFGVPLWGVEVPETWEEELLDRLFGGYATTVTPAEILTLSPKLTVWRIDCQGYDTLLTTYVPMAAEWENVSDKSLIQGQLATAYPEIDITDVDAVETISIEYSGDSLRDIFERISELTGGEWWIDADKKFHYKAPLATPAPFGLSETPDGVTTVAFERTSFDYQEEFTTPCNKATVVGALITNDTAIVQTYQDPASQAEFGRIFSRTIVDRRIGTVLEANLRAQIEVDTYAYPTAQGTAVFWEDGADVGQTINVQSPSRVVNGNFLIRRMTMTWKSKTLTQYQIEFGHYRPDLARAIRRLAALARDKGNTPVAVPSDGSVNDDKITDVDAGKITGSITAGQIGSVNAAAITGLIQAGQIEEVNAGAIIGSIVAGQIGSVNAGVIQGVIVSSQVADDLINGLAKIANALRPIPRAASAPALPDAVNYPAGSFYYNTTDSKFYKTINGLTWAEVTEGEATTGKFEYYNLGSIVAGKIVGLIVAAQIGSVNASAIVGSITASQIGSVNASVIQGGIVASQITSVNASAITGSIVASQIASVSASTITGTIVASQIASVSASTITGTITSTQIGSVNAETITINLIQSSQINSIAAGKITAGTIVASVSMTAPTLTITRGTITINIDATNYIKITDTGANNSIVQVDSALRVMNRTSQNQRAQVGQQGFDIQDINGNPVGSCVNNNPGGVGYGLFTLWNNNVIKVQVSASAGDAIFAGYLKFLSLRSGNYAVSGSPASAATHKVPFYDANGNLLNYFYLYP